MTKKKYILGTRGSKLALAQSQSYLEKLEKKFPKIDFEIKIISTLGDRDQQTPLSNFQQRGVFTNSIEEALLSKEIDFGVHSLKDLPSQIPDGLKLIDLPPVREDPRDALLTRQDFTLLKSPIIGTSSLRREVQLKELFPKAQFKPIRGNVDTRIKKLKEGEYDGIVLAQAGLNRLGIKEDFLEKQGIHHQVLDSFFPAPAQGILGIEIREEDKELETLLSSIGDLNTGLQMKAERIFLEILGGNCKTPVGCYCQVMENRFSLYGLYGSLVKEETGFYPLENLEKITKAFAEGFKIKEVGKVYLTGAGCGDPELITLKALKVLQKADVIIYDALIDPSLLKERKDTAKLIYVGKRSKDHTLKQEEINTLLVTEARKGKTVVRLKGGDPYVFGRGGEEGEFLHDHRIPFEVIPGISAVIAGPAYAGIPLTHRENNQAFMVLTGHTKTGSKEQDWANIAGFNGTVVILMGVKNLPGITSKLIENGKDPRIPVALIENATTPKQRIIITTLEEAVETAIKYQFSSPGIIVIGENVNYYAKLERKINRSLKGKRILVTRARSQASELVQKLEELGAETIEFPVIKIQEDKNTLEGLKEKLKHLEDYSHLIFTSVNAVEIFFRILNEIEFDRSTFDGIKIAAIGSATERKIKDFGMQTDIVPETFCAESLLGALEPTLDPDSKILLPRSAEARKFLSDQLQKLAEVDEVYLYHTIPDGSNYDLVKKKLEQGAIDAITFTSSSTVKKLLSFFPVECLDKINCYSIGPITTQTLRESGLSVKGEAQEFTISGLVDVIERTENGITTH